MKKTPLLLLLLAALAACDDPVANVGASLRSWCANQPNCDVRDKNEAYPKQRWPN